MALILRRGHDSGCWAPYPNSWKDSAPVVLEIDETVDVASRAAYSARLGLSTRTYRIWKFAIWIAAASGDQW
jgi:hypothetical protein